MKKLSSWWNALTPREHVLISVMLTSLTLFGVYYGLLAPLKNYQQSGVLALKAAKVESSQLAQSLSEYQKLQAQAKPQPLAQSNQDLRSSIASAARKTGLQINRIQPDGEKRLILTMNETQPSVLFRWLSEMRDTHGATIVRASLEPDDKESSLRVRLVIERM